MSLLATSVASERPTTKKQAADLLNQQLWCWGQDVLCDRGNLLVEHGFERVEKPAGSQCASLYTLALSSTSRVILRGFGVFYGDDDHGGLFLERFGFTPKLTPQATPAKPPWSTEDLPPLSLPIAEETASCQHLLLGLLGWIHQYETWIAEHRGIDYRSEVLESWQAKRGAVVPASEQAEAWHRLGSAVADSPDHFIACVGARK